MLLSKVALRSAAEPLSWWWKGVFIGLSLIYWRWYDGCRSQTISMTYRYDRYGVVLLYIILNFLALYDSIRYILSAYDHHDKRVLRASSGGNGINEGQPLLSTGKHTGDVESGLGASRVVLLADKLGSNRDQYIFAFVFYTIIKLIAFNGIFSNHVGNREVYHILYITYLISSCDVIDITNEM
jgi:hypothetical protein